MQIMYIDESGDTTQMWAGGKQFFVLTGCIMDANDKVGIEGRLRGIKEAYYQNPEIEIKSNFLRYANPDSQTKSPIKLQDRQTYNALEAEITRLLQEIPVSICSIVVDKLAYWQQYPSENPYEIAYRLLTERFQYYLESVDDLGIIIIDPREGRVEKTYIGTELDKIHNQMRWEQDGFWKSCPRVIERVLFSTSDKTIGIQLADLYCYPVYHVFNYNKTQQEYWRYDKVTFQKFRRHNGRLDGVGLKVFPKESKKGLRLYQD